jgi:hypothetical protein
MQEISMIEEEKIHQLETSASNVREMESSPQFGKLAVKSHAKKTKPVNQATSFKEGSDDFGFETQVFRREKNSRKVSHHSSDSDSEER